MTRVTAYVHRPNGTFNLPSSHVLLFHDCAIILCACAKFSVVLMRKQSNDRAFQANANRCGRQLTMVSFTSCSRSSIMEWNVVMALCPLLGGPGSRCSSLYMGFCKPFATSAFAVRMTCNSTCINMYRYLQTQKNIYICMFIHFVACIDAWMHTATPIWQYQKLTPIGI